MPFNTTTGIAAAAAALVVVAGAGGAYYWKTHPGIHGVDFRNGPVEVFGTACADPDLTNAAVTTIPLHDGSYQLGKYQFELVGDVKYGDVSGQTNQDSGDKAVFIGSCNSGSATSQVLFVYGMQDGKLTRLATADLSDSGSSVVLSYGIANGAIQIHENQGTPPQLTTVSYALLGGTLQNVGGGAAPTQMAANTGTPTTTNSGTAVAASSVSDDTSGDDKVSFQYFQDQLSPYGQWMHHDRWGDVWRPNSEGDDFHPYRQDGHWENTDQDGMTWVSDNDWGDVVYHYGRWVYDPDPQYHWVWVPDYTYAPSWVAWRAGRGYVAWMPLPPNGYEGEGVDPANWSNWYGYRDLYSDMDQQDFDGLWNVVAVDGLWAPHMQYAGLPVYEGFIGDIPDWTDYAVVGDEVVVRAFDPVRFRVAFGRGLRVEHGHAHFRHGVLRTSRHGGERIALREHGHGHDVHVGIHAGVPHSFHHGMEAHGGFGRAGAGMKVGFHAHEGSAMGRGHSSTGIGHAHNGFGRSHGTEGFSRSAGASHHSGFARSGGAGFGRTGAGYGRGKGIARTGQGYTRSGGVGRTGYGPGNGGGYGRSASGFNNSPTRSFNSSGYGGGMNRGFGNGGNRGFNGGGFGGGGNRAFVQQPQQRVATPRVNNNGGNTSGGQNRRRGH
jgi:hypothetical protein